VLWLPWLLNSSFGDTAMNAAQQKIMSLVEKAKDVHSREPQVTLESIRMVGEFENLNAACQLLMSSQEFAKVIGLSPNQYWKRAQAARVIRRFPETQALLEAGETEICHLSLVAGKITDANAPVILAELKGKSRRELETFLSRVTPDGQIKEKEVETELRLKLTQTQMAALDRAREVLSHGGHVPNVEEIIAKALGDLLEKRDPVKKAERAVARKESGKQTAKVPSPGKEKGSRYIPMAVRHQVMLRDGGQCTAMLHDGKRCPERLMLEFDHIELYARGGANDVDNIRLKCRRHNLWAAKQVLGVEFMDRKLSNGGS